MPLLARVAAALRSLPASLGRESSRAYIPELDGLRFLAILFVLAWHSALRAARYIDHVNAGGAHLKSWFSAFPHGEVGVILFFFISGFVVSQPFVARPRQSWRIGDFYKRRFMRIYPPYLIVMSLCFIVLGVLHHTPVDAYAYQYATVPLDQSFLASLVYLHGIVFDSPSRLNPPMWSLEIEVAFYAILPPLMLLYCAGRKGGRRVALMCAAIAGAVVLSSLLIHSVETDLRLRWGLFFHAYLFLMGIVVADVVGDPTQRESRKRPAFDLLFAAGLCAILVIGWLMTQHDARMPNGLYALGIQALTIAAILLVFFGAFHGRYASALLSLPWLRLIGTMCYSIYLTHIIVMTAVGEVLGRVLHVQSVALIYAIYIGALIGAALVAGTLFYVCVERPFAQMLVRPKARREPVLAAPVGAEASR